MSFRSELAAGRDEVQPRPYEGGPSRPIHVTTDMLGSPVPTQVIAYKAGTRYQMPHELADVFVREGWGKEVPFSPPFSVSEDPADLQSPPPVPAPPPLHPEHPAKAAARLASQKIPAAAISSAVNPPARVVAVKGSDRREFETVTALCKDLGLNRKAADRALKTGKPVLGWTVARATTAPVSPPPTLPAA